MNNGSGVSRGDRNRNARLVRLREMVPSLHAIVGIDLADRKQMVVVSDHDSKVLARRTFRCKAWDLGSALDWAAQHAGRAGYCGVTVACEPTGHRWRVLGQLAADRGMPFVCVQPMLSSWARKTEDLTTDKTDDKDAVLIARLAGQLRCYVPEPVDETWGRLRHLGVRREQLLGEHVGCVQQIRDLLECVAGRAGEREAALQVHDLGRGDERHHRTRRRRLCPDPTAGPGPVGASGAGRGRAAGQDQAVPADPAAVVCGAVGPGRGAGAPPGGVRADRLADRGLGQRQGKAGPCRAADARGVGRAGPDRPRLFHQGPVRGRAAAIVAGTGDLHRFTSARAVVKHAGLAPRERMSGTFTGRARLTGAGRPGLRTAAWRAVWGAQRANPVYAARYRHLTTREENRLKAPQAQTVIAAAILRQLHAVVTTGRAWDPNIAAHGTRVPEVAAA